MAGTYDHLINTDLLGYFLGKLDARYGGGATYTDVSVAATGWTQDANVNAYTKTVTVSGLTASDRVTVLFCPPHDLGEFDTQEEAFNLIYAAESVSGGVKLYAVDQPSSAFTITAVY